MRTSKLNVAWDKIFLDLNILALINKDGYYDISANDIKRISGEESRLMAKVDSENKLPSIMEENGLSILAIKNGLYRIAKINPFLKIKNLSKEIKIEEVDFPSDFITINPHDLTSESMVLDACQVSGILDKVFKEPTRLTMRGRVRSSNFKITLDNIPFDINGVQIEVDGGYEGKNSINLVEAKMGFANTVSIRQILYPIEEVSNIFKKKDALDNKKINAYVCFYEKGIIRFIPIIKQKGTLVADHANERVFKFKKRIAA